VPVISDVHIQTALRNGSTFLKSAYCTPPFKVADVTENKNENALQLMLMNSSPGVLDGDENHIQIDIQEGCSLQLQTQSYQRLFQMKKGASQQMVVHLSKNASFCFLPHPVVPHAASHFTAKSKIYLSEGCSLIWGEVLTCGRKLNGEVFSFTRYHNVTEIYLLDKLVVKENLLLQPALTDMAALGQLEGYTHQASLIYLHETVEVRDLIKQISEDLEKEQHITFGITTTPVNGIILRVLGYKAEQLYRCLNKIARDLQQENGINKELLTAKSQRYAK
jgi:urease accessory protein